MKHLFFPALLSFLFFLGCPKKSTIVEVNADPEIISAGPSSSTAVPGDSVEFTVDATDAEGNVLTIAWKDSVDTLVGSGASFTWVAPTAEGTYNFTVEIGDGNGGRASKTVSVVVSTAGVLPMINSAPIITSLIATPLIIPMGGDVAVALVAFDPDGDSLSFEWNSKQGDFDGTGKDVTWKAPEGAP